MLSTSDGWPAAVAELASGLVWLEDGVRKFASEQRSTGRAEKDVQFGFVAE